jgi:hypothetical protein
VPLDDRIPEMTETELLNLRANATRLTQSGSAPQKAEAERLMPLIAAALEARKTSKAENLAQAKTKRREAAAETRRRKAESAKAEKAERAERSELA